MKVLYTSLAAAGWAWLAVAGAYLFARLWKEQRQRGFDVVVKDDEK